jgi:DNA-binding CsgD family transcriptional regulator
VLHDGDVSYQVIGIERPDSRLVSRLTPAEFLVARLLIEGKSHAEIAAQRRTTLRTVANQLATAFHRLGVSGRLGLIGQLAQNQEPVLKILASPARGSVSRRRAQNESVVRAPIS